MTPDPNHEDMPCDDSLPEDMAIEPHGTFQSRAADKMDQLLMKAYAHSGNAERYVRKALGDAWNVCHFSHLPQWLQDNDYLHKWHRPPLESFQACFWSVFRLHTETANIWTHFIGCLIFTFLAIDVLILNTLPLSWEDKLVFGTFFAGAIICLGLSSTYHTFSCHSQRVGRLCSKLDYCGIALLITGSFVPWLYYGFYCEFLPKLFYLVLTITLGILTVIVSMSERFSVPHYRSLRAGVFTSFGLSGVVPGIHWVLTQDWFYSVGLRTAFCCLILMGVLYITGAMLYALRIPERFFPGKCDVWFHSHQLFHVLVIAAAIVHYHGISEMAIYRLSNDAVCAAPDPVVAAIGPEVFSTPFIPVL